MKTSAIREKLEMYCDTISQKDGIVTIRQSYYWGITKSGEHLANAVKKLFPQATDIDFGNQYKAFRGGATVAQGSHFWCKFRLPEEVAA